MSFFDPNTIAKEQLHGVPAIIPVVPPPLIVHLPPSGAFGRKRPKRFEPTLTEMGLVIMVIARRHRHARHN